MKSEWRKRGRKDESVEASSLRELFEKFHALNAAMSNTSHVDGFYDKNGQCYEGEITRCGRSRMLFVWAVSPFTGPEEAWECLRYDDIDLNRLYIGETRWVVQFRR